MRLVRILSAAMCLAIAQPAAAITLYHNLPSPTLNAWTSFSIPMQETGWRVDHYSTGASASQTQMLWVLGHLSALYLLTEWRTGPDDTNVDNIQMGSGPDDFFGAGNGGWMVAGPVPTSDIADQAVPTSALAWDAAFGNPPGSVRVGDVYFWTWIAAPAGYLGNQSARYGENLTADIYIRFTDNVAYPMLAFVAPDVPPGWSPVPVPGTALLFAFGLIAAARLRRR